jgi:hypothetical protein
MQLKSLAFKDGKEIPNEYTCDSSTRINPPLSFSEVPLHTKSFVLILEDPDIPEDSKQRLGIQVWDHWVLFNIPGDTREIEENTIPIGVSGINTNGNIEYTPPCPPYGVHRYIFKLYALDTMLSLPEGSTKDDVLSAIRGHVLGEAELIGRYQRI